jgi:hypothetical protein
MESSKETHQNFFSVLSPNKLNELYHRASSGLLQKHINEKLQDGYSVVILGKRNFYCSIYIKLFTKDGKQIGHISLHLDPANKHIKTSNGRLHTCNNISTNRKYPLIIERIIDENQNSISMSLNTYPKIKNILYQMVNITLSILELYFNPRSELYLSNHLTPNSNSNHECSGYVIGQFNKTRKKLQKTRKRYWKR